jgi:hypothetical protein
MPIQYKKIRFNKSCPDGMEHQMSDGIWMCGRIHKEEPVETLQDGGLLVGPSHAEGGIPAIVGGNTPIELEGGEYIINAQTVDAVGQEFLDELNSTETSYHTGGYGAGELPPPSEFKDGGAVYQDGGEVIHLGESTGSILPTEEERDAGVYAYGGDVSDINYFLEGPSLNEPPENKTYPNYTRGEIPMSKRGGITKRNFQEGGTPKSGVGSIQQSGILKQRKTKPKPKSKAIIGAPKCPGGYMIAGRCVKDTPSPFKMFGGGEAESSGGGNECEAGFTLAADGTCIPTTG